MTASGYGSGLPSTPNRVGAASHGTGLPNDAIQFIAYDPAGGDVERAWRIKNLNDYLSAGAGVALSVTELAFNTAGLKSGIKAFTLPADAYIPSNGTALILVTPFNGSTPSINFGLTQADSLNSGSPLSSSFVTIADTDQGDGTFSPTRRNQLQNRYATPNPVDIWIGLDDGSGGDPGSTVGLAYWVVSYWPTA